MNHPSDLDLDSFLDRTASARELVDVAAHLAECAECRARLNATDGIAALHRQLASARSEGHLSEEDVQVLAQGGRAVEHESHLANCAMCRAEVEDLRQFIQARKRSVRAPYWLAAAALIALLVGGIAIFQWQSQRAMPAAYTALIQQVRTSGRFEIPAAIAALQRAPEQLLGERPPVAQFTLLSPVGEASFESRPQFSWQALSGATRYRVDIYDEDFRKIASSSEITATSWTPAEALDYTHTYSWTVTARSGEKEIREPVPPAPEAKFKIVPPDQAAPLSDAVRKYPNDHLLLAALYAQAGAMDEARRELKAMDDRDLARRLADSLAPR